MTPLHPRASLARVAEIFFRIGNTTFGGGYVTIGMLERELVDQRKILDRSEFDLAFAVSRITPGTILLAFCAATGDRLRGMLGAVIAILALTVPSAAIAILLIQGFETWQTNPVAAAIIAGTVAAVSGMMWSVVWTLLRPHAGGFLRNLQILLITGGSFLASWKFDVGPLTIIIAGTLIGFLWPDRDAAKPPSTQASKKAEFQL